MSFRDFIAKVDPQPRPAPKIKTVVWKTRTPIRILSRPEYPWVISAFNDTHFVARTPAHYTPYRSTDVLPRNEALAV